MKMSNLKSIALAAMLCLPLTAGAGDKIGGGGDASEMRMNEIRVDLLKWISKGGAQALQLPVGMTYEEYENKMVPLLLPKAVVFSFTSKDNEVIVDHQPKTCMGFQDAETNAPHILCSLKRFSETSEEGQYSLFHHEIAGLAGVEKNEGAASDYFVSSQLTYSLEKTTVLRLAVKSSIAANQRKPGNCEINLVNFDRFTSDAEVLKLLQKKNFEVTQDTSEHRLVRSFNRVGTRNVSISLFLRMRLGAYEETVSRVYGAKVNDFGKGSVAFPFDRQNFPEKSDRLERNSILKAIAQLEACKTM
ncbi:MAG: hypothetical protein H7222_14845 [Methylotenera sp.]|nr:hypothetical protein [Oligoflexia bacterium]